MPFHHNFRDNIFFNLAKKKNGASHTVRYLYVSYKIILPDLTWSLSLISDVNTMETNVMQQATVVMLHIQVQMVQNISVGWSFRENRKEDSGSIKKLYQGDKHSRESLEWEMFHTANNHELMFTISVVFKKSKHCKADGLKLVFKVLPGTFVIVMYMSSKVWGNRTNLQHPN